MTMNLSSLSLREKVMQTVVLRIQRDAFVPEPVGAAFFFGEIITEESDLGLDQARAVLQAYADNTKVPILLVSDFENGCGSMLKGLTPLPYLMSLGAANDPYLAYDYGLATALEARSVGANWSFSPVSDLNLNFRNPLINVRGLTDDPDLVCRLLTQVVRGMQDGGLAACAKHFPGDGVDWRDQHIVTTCNSLSREDWLRLSGRVFQSLIDCGVDSIMAGHITLPAFQQEKGARGLCPPATLSRELITGLLKEQMGFDGVVVTDALDMGGFGGWYPSRQEAELAAFAAGCDMLLWPSAEYPDRLEKAVRDGDIPMERLDDAVSRILRMKQRRGLFDGRQRPVPLTDEQKAFVRRTQQRVAEASITLLRDEAGLFPIDPKTRRRVAVVPVTEWEPAFAEAELLCRELCARGFAAELRREGLQKGEEDGYDLILYALFSRPFRPIGFLDFHAAEARKIQRSLQDGVDKTCIVSFGSPYFADQYAERALTCVNAYSMLSPSVRAFVRAATGEIPFSAFSPVRLHQDMEPMPWW